MRDLLWSILTIVVIALFVLGNITNGFIAMVNCTDWIRRRRMSSADWVLTALAVSRIGCLWVIFINWFLMLFHPAFFSSELRIIGFIAWVVTNHFSTWLAACLSIIYLLKIANFSNFLFHQLKMRVKKVIAGILLGTSGLLLPNLVMVHINSGMDLKDHDGNMTWRPRLSTAIDLSCRRVYSLVSCVPFMTSLVCVLLLIFSLGKHLRKMRLHSKGPQDPSTSVHVKALQMVVSFVLLFAVYALSLIVSTWSFNRFQKKPTFFFSQAMGIVYLSIHSFILVWGSKKLKETFLLGLWQATCWLKNQKPSSP